MRLRLFRAGSMPAALAQARAELGDEALILSSRRIAGGVEVTAALDHEPPVPPPPPPPGQTQPADLAALRWHGIPAPIAERLGRGPLPNMLADLLRFGTLPLEPPCQPLLLTGPPGAGKTLTIARLATRLVLADTAPLVITADGRRAGAAEELAAYTRLLGLSLVVASHPATLVRALQHRPPAAPVLIDTAGIDPFDHTHMETIAALIAAAAALPVMVLPAGYDPLESAEQAAAFAAIGVCHFVPTRLDLARRLGAVVAAAIAGSMTLSEAGTGAGATDGLTPLTAEFLAARLSRMPVPRTRATRKVPDANPQYL